MPRNYIKLLNGLRKNWIIVLIFLLSLFLRFYNISSVPYALDGDEAAIGYYGYSLLHNLSDEYGNKLPLYFPSIGDYKYPVYSYLSVIPVFLFGLNEFSVRFTSAFLGSLLPILIYLISLHIFKSKVLSIFSSFMCAISPFAIMFSRGAYESNVALFFISLGTLILLNAINKKSGNLYLSIAPFLIAIFSYPAEKIYLPLFLLLTFFVTKNIKLLKIFIIIVAVVSVTFLDKRSMARAEGLGFNQPNYYLNNIKTDIWEDGLILKGKNIYLTRIFHNKILSFVTSFGTRYFQHFDPVYLFFESNPAMPKYSVPHIGIFYFFEIITILVGFYSISKYKDPIKYIPLIMIIASVVPSALTVETPSPIRTLCGLAGWVILSGAGVYFLVDKIKWKKTYSYIIFILISSIHLLYFLHQYMIHDISSTPWYSDGGMKEMVETITNLESKYDNVVIGGDPYIFFLLYNKISPKEFLSSAKIEPEEFGKWNRVKSFGKIIFGMPIGCPKIGKEKTIYVCRGGDIPINSNLLKTIRFNDGNVAFNIIEFVPISKSLKKDLPEGVHYMVQTDLFFPEALLPKDSDRFW